MANTTYTPTSAASHHTSEPPSYGATARSIASPITIGTAACEACCTTISAVAGTVSRFTANIDRRIS